MGKKNSKIESDNSKRNYKAKNNFKTHAVNISQLGFDYLERHYPKKFNLKSDEVSKLNTNLFLNPEETHLYLVFDQHFYDFQDYNFPVLVFLVESLEVCYCLSREDSIMKEIQFLEKTRSFCIQSHNRNNSKLDQLLVYKYSHDPLEHYFLHLLEFKFRIERFKFLGRICAVKFFGPNTLRSPYLIKTKNRESNQPLKKSNRLISQVGINFYFHCVTDSSPFLIYNNEYDSFFDLVILDRSSKNRDPSCWFLAKPTQTSLKHFPLQVTQDFDIQFKKVFQKISSFVLRDGQTKLVWVCLHSYKTKSTSLHHLFQKKLVSASESQISLWKFYKGNLLSKRKKLRSGDFFTFQAFGASTNLLVMSEVPNKYSFLWIRVKRASFVPIRLFSPTFDNHLMRNQFLNQKLFWNGDKHILVLPPELFQN